MRRGLFITLEGSDGSGKSTQLKRIESFLSEKGYHTVVTREPGGTVISEKIRELLLDKNHSEMDGRTEALLYAASRAQHVTEVIKPALERGDVVICDRFIDSSIVYQGHGRKLGEQVEMINQFAVAGYMPDITFLFKINPEVGKSRIKTRNKDRLECEHMEFYKEVFRGYTELEKRYPDRIIGIDASRSIREIHAEIRERLEVILCSRFHQISTGAFTKS